MAVNRALPITITERERDLLRQMAKHHGVSMAALVRGMIRKAALETDFIRMASPSPPPSPSPADAR